MSWRDATAPLIILPVRNVVLFPGVLLSIAVGRPRSMAGAQLALREQRPIGILMQRDARVSDPQPIDLHRIGTLANIVRCTIAPDGSYHLVCQGEQRFRVTDFVRAWPFFAAGALRLAEAVPRTPEIEACFHNLKSQVVEAAQLLPHGGAEILAAVLSVQSPAALADLAAAAVDMKPEERQDILETLDVAARMDKVSRLLSQIGRPTKAVLGQRQPGQSEEGKETELSELEDAIAEAGMPKEIERHARKELRRLQRTPEAAAEHGLLRSYLEWMIELPWRLPEESAIDIAEARRVLDEDHYGLDKIKRWIIEYLAVRKLAMHGNAPILCFAGPPSARPRSASRSPAP